MANYTSVCRTNYFQVKDERKFEAWAASTLQLRVEKRKLDGAVQVALFADDGWPDTRENDYGDRVPLDMEEELRAHLEEGEVVVMLEVGSERNRYLIGGAVVISQDGVESLDLEEEAMRIAKKMAGGRPVTLPQY